jgi:hypothetical protein
VVNGRATPEARLWEDYLHGVVQRVGLPTPVPRWAVTDLRRAGRAHLKYLRLDSLAEAEANPKEARRLRSEARREDSKARTAENVLTKLVERLRQHRGPTSLVALARGRG